MCVCVQSCGMCAQCMSHAGEILCYNGYSPHSAKICEYLLKKPWSDFSTIQHHKEAIVFILK